ncbi:MAG: M48 family metallopeptidase [Burkholderiales bacterium]
MNDAYPAGPADVPADLTVATAAYRRRAWIALGSLAVFVVLYTLLAAWFTWSAYRLIGMAIAGSRDGFLYVIAGLGAAFLAVFMLKALVFLRKGEAPDAVEVNAAEQPRLFEFIHRLADDAGAPRPHRVFLSARVNAAVFYDLSLLNLIVPSRKNLEIGLALVNVLTLSELKAVLAHEFGHFAQRTMAVGSWVYIAHQIAAHIVAKRDFLDRILRYLSHMDPRIAWVGWLLSLIVWSIRSLMDSLLRVVLLAQRALSRQMEFQADLVAVSLTGSDELVHALHKLHAADDAWGRTLGFLHSEAAQGRRPHDLFAVQSWIVGTIGRILDDEQYGRVPARPDAATPESHRVFKSAFAQPPQMWSTHPANADREQNAKLRYLAAPHDARSAWTVFDDVGALKDRMVAQVIGDTATRPVPEAETFAALEAGYTRLRYEPRFRGAYLGRPLTRHAARPDQLYEALLQQPGVAEALDTLYPESLGDDLDRLRALSEERALLEALRDKVFEATGGQIVFRGREISRRALPGAIREVMQEEEAVRERVFAHDRRCRSHHLAAARGLGGGWEAYLAGLVHALHYGEHTLADLNDAQGVLSNVLAIVTADGKVSGRELKRLVAAANSLHKVLAGIHGMKAAVSLDEGLTVRLGVAQWSDALEAFRLPEASAENINEWLQAIDGWVGNAASALSALVGASTEQLLATEDAIASALKDRSEMTTAPSPTRVPEDYPVLLPGTERKRQRRLGLWDRFQTADGTLAAAARLLVAVVIVAAVLWAGSGSSSGVAATVSLHNGLGRPVIVRIDDRTVALEPSASTTIDMKSHADSVVDTITVQGRSIERFTPRVETYFAHYAYNVAGASPLVAWEAAYGSSATTVPTLMGTPRWTRSTAEFVFTEPPQTVSTKRGGATRSVLSGLAGRPPAEILEAVPSEFDRRDLVRIHAQWDEAGAPHAEAWQALARDMGMHVGGALRQ